MKIIYCQNLTAIFFKCIIIDLSSFSSVDLMFFQRAKILIAEGVCTNTNTLFKTNYFQY